MKTVPFNEKIVILALVNFSLIIIVIFRIKLVIYKYNILFLIFIYFLAHSMFQNIFNIFRATLTKY